MTRDADVIRGCAGFASGSVSGRCGNLAIPDDLGDPSYGMCRLGVSNVEVVSETSPFGRRGESATRLADGSAGSHTNVTAKNLQVLATGWSNAWALENASVSLASGSWFTSAAKAC